WLAGCTGRAQVAPRSDSACAFLRSLSQPPAARGGVLDMSAVDPGAITSALAEKRVFPPSPEFVQTAHIRSMADYERMWKRSIDDTEGFWAEAARELHWFKPWSKVLEWNLPDAKWYAG